ncbi:unnamed protein product [Owenia fusiformis]|uniref:Mismatch repair endonuclease PMS2 n=1 Tax=Owenia fusiformis TaxID=6347 RepID=A0A8S4PPQ7_OWEFU|nr:unnamed protein product [Owenia fusiformis]
MMSGNIEAIDKGTVHRICSGQVVLNLATAVKELVENSLDAGANSIEVRLKEYGSAMVEVVDNGSGVEKDNFKALTLKHHTSKLREFSDLEGVETFGFRGEALSSLCALSDVVVVTRHKDACVGTQIDFNHHGNITKQTSLARQIGTTVRLQQLFSTLPVRHKEFLRNLKREFSKMVQVLNAYCIISSGVRIICTNILESGKKNIVLSTNSNSSMRDSITNIFGPKQMQSLLEISQHRPEDDVCQDMGIKPEKVDEQPFKISGYISQCVHGQGRSSADRQFIFINKRPCDFSKVTKLVNEVYHMYNRHQYPMVVLDISLDKQSVDVNVTPDKRQIFVLQEKLLLATLKTSLVKLFEPTSSMYQMHVPTKPIGVTPVTPDSTSPATDSKNIQGSSSSLLAKMKRTFTSAFSQQDTSDRKANSQPSKQPKLDSFFASTPPVPCSSHGRQSPSHSSSLSSPYSSKEEQSPSKLTVELTSGNDDTHIESCRKAETINTRIHENNSSIQNSNMAGISSNIDTGLDKSTSDINKEMETQNPPSDQLVIECPISNGESVENTAEANPIEPKSCNVTDYDAKGRPERTQINDLNNVKHTVLVETPVPQRNPCSEIIKNEESENITKNDIDISESNNELNSNVKEGLLIDLDTPDNMDTVDTDTISARRESWVDILHNNISIDDTSVDAETIERDAEDVDANGNGKSDENLKNVNDDNFLQAQSHEYDINSFSTYRKKQKTVQFSMHKLRERLQSQPKKTPRKELFRNFRATISPTENTRAEEELRKEIRKDMFAEMQVLGQFNLGFIIARLGDDLFIVDQHATDEKYNFEMLQRHTTISSQTLVCPQSLELTAVSEQELLDSMEIFNKNGFKFLVDENALPTKRVKLQATPISRNWTFGKEDIDEMLFMLNDAPGVMCRPSKVRQMFASRACRKSIMIGTALSKSHMKQVLRHMGEIEQPWNCPHGRPTMRHLINLNMLPNT